jgi:hypothetical protein
MYICIPMAKYKTESKRMNIEIPISHIEQVKKVIHDYLSMEGLTVKPSRHKDIKPVNCYLGNRSILVCPHCDNEIEL